MIIELCVIKKSCVEDDLNERIEDIELVMDRVFNDVLGIILELVLYINGVEIWGNY